MRTLNKRVACVPTEKISMEVKTTRGLALPEEKQTFLSTKTMFPHRSSVLEPGVTWAAGTTVHLPGEMYRHEWNRKVFTHKDAAGVEMKFILVPEDQIIAVEDGEDPQVPRAADV